MASSAELFRVHTVSHKCPVYLFPLYQSSILDQIHMLVQMRKGTIGKKKHKVWGEPRFLYGGRPGNAGGDRDRLMGSASHYASSTYDAYFAQGFNAARDRL